MKKKISLVLIAVMAMLCVLGCSKDNISTKDNDKETKSEKTTEAVKESTKETEKTTKATEKESTTKSTEKKTEAQATEKTSAAAVSIKRGTVKNGTYTNESVGINFPTSDFALILNDTQIAQVIGYGNNIISDNGIASMDQLEKVSNGCVYDFAGYFSDNMSSYMLMFENLEKTVGKEVSETVYLTALKTQMGKVTSPKYDTSDSIKQVTIAGETYYAVTFKIQGSDASQTYYVKKSGKYMIGMILTYTSSSESEAKAFINKITK